MSPSVAVAFAPVNPNQSINQPFRGRYLRDVAREIRRRRSSAERTRKNPTVRDVVRRFERNVDITVKEVVIFVAIIATMLMTLYFLIAYVGK